jgi:hypothetical protein
MERATIQLRSISEILGESFYIPNYQRGFRWKEQQVKDLLDDIDEFLNTSFKDDFYCLQPLVVKETIPDTMKLIKELPKEVNDKDVLCKVKGAIKNNVRWEVIDGQQRLTTIFLLLGALDVVKEPFSIEYETREPDFISNINNDNADGNIDHHMIKMADGVIKNWFKNKAGEVYKKKFKEILLEKVQFIWYESDEDPVKVFTRLNIGKISLTNAELIKALFLNRSNFAGEDCEKQRLKQYEIASQWDNIEYSLQNEEFWLFLNNIGYNNPTRIDFIFNLMCDMGDLDKFIDWKNDKQTDIGADKYRTFRYFNAYFHPESSKPDVQDNNSVLIEQCWADVITIFQIFEEWFNDVELYHYVGFLIDNGSNINDILKEWRIANDKQAFVAFLKNKIKDTIKYCKNLSSQYEIEGKPKTDCKPLLLLHNIQTVIVQNRNSHEDYELGLFYKFPFHLYKIEKWDVEHIDSNAENDLNEKKAQNEFLLNVYNGVSLDEQKEIKKFIENPDAKFDSFKDKYKTHSNSLDESEKNQIWNFTLLDSSTNRSYGNSIFSAKRRIIIW